MKVVILAGGFGTRISEESHLRPKPMIEVGEHPVLWHIMKIYSHYGYNDFVVCLGYKGYVIKEYFANYFLHNSDVTIDLCRNSMEIINSKAEPWRVTLVDTGLRTTTGGRVKRIQPYTGNKTFMLTYGDGVGDVNIAKLVEHHRKQGKYATITAVQPPGRFGALGIDDDENVISFHEKPPGDSAWINGGFFVLEPKIFDYIKSEEVSWEGQPLPLLAAEGQIAAYRHYGFWRPMDTVRDRMELEGHWKSGNAPWQVWT
ncbi:MAG TPA: glucose-1-phosphate cytidylyltransferase [Dissulfurispiraceae bacterium]